MYRKNDDHLQKPMFSSLFDLPDKEKERLSRSWAGTFYEACFCQIDEDIFSILYSDKASRPNIAVNVLVSLEIMKSGFGWSDADLEEALHFNLLVRYAVGYSSLDEGHFELRTMYNFRQKLVQHMQQTGENLLEEMFEQLTDKQIAKLKVKTNKLRMDSTQMGSHMRQMSRLQLLVEVLQRVWRMLDEDDRATYEEMFAPYVKNTSGQYVYHLKAGKGQSQLKQIGRQMQELVKYLTDKYQDEPPYQVLERVYDEHFIEDSSGLRAKDGEELSATSLQSVDDWEASYRQKQGKQYQGYVTNVTETCDPDNELQLIVKVQTEPNTTDDAVMLDDAVPNLVERMDVDEVYTDGGFNSPEVDKTLQANRIEQFQTAIRGNKSSEHRLSVSEFVFTRDEHGQPQQIWCPQGQEVEVQPARKQGRFTALFDPEICQTCPLFAKCPTKPLHRKPKRVLRFDQQQVNVAHRHANRRQAKASGRNLRSAVEATVRSLKHPFGNGKLPVRGKRRMSMMIIASATMTNVRRIWRYEVAEKTPQNGQTTGKTTFKQAFDGIVNVCSTFWASIFTLFELPFFYQMANI
jgi:Transposase DDE domain/Transposase domain (DUF772)